MAAAIAAIAVIVMRESPLADHPIIEGGHQLERVAFSDIPGWHVDDPSDALQAFRRSCAALTTADRTDGLFNACRMAADLPSGLAAEDVRAFFERHFVAYRIAPADGQGLLTAYYEPEIPGSRSPSERYSTPLRALPADYVTVDHDTDSNRLDPELTTARRTSEGLKPWPTRGEIAEGALEGIAEPLVWVEDPVDAFFIHIQGSSRIALDNGETMRIGFAGRNGHPYTSVGQRMMERGIEPPEGYSMDGIRAFFRDRPDLARELMNENRSYIFFREIDGLDPELGPIGAQGVPLTDGRSMAVDPDFHRLGMPIFVDAALPTGANRAMEPFRRLMIAQDTGAAIKGPARGDLFWGTGREAGSGAGDVKGTGIIYLLLPHGP